MTLSRRGLSLFGMRFTHLFRALVLGGAALSGSQCGTDQTDPNDPDQNMQAQGNENPDGGTDGGTGGGTHAGTGGGGTSSGTGGGTANGIGGGHPGGNGGQGGVGPW